MLSQMSNMTKDSTNRTGLGLTVCGMSHLLTFDTILLCRKGEGNERGRKELETNALGNIKMVRSTNLELDIFKSKQMFCIAGGVCIFTGLQKEVECHPNAIDGSLVSC